MTERAMYRVFFTNADGESTIDFMMGSPNALIAKKRSLSWLEKCMAASFLTSRSGMTNQNKTPEGQSSGVFSCSMI